MKFEIPGRLPGFNEIIEAAKLRGRNYKEYATMKDRNTQMVAWLAKKAGLPKYEKAYLVITWYEPNSRRDPDNVMAGEPLLLEWSGTTTSGALNIELWQDDLGGPPEYVGTIATATPDAGQYLWDPVDSFNYGSNAWFTLKIVDAVMPGCEAFTDTFQMWDVDICTCQVLGFPAEAVFDEGQVVNLTFDQQNSSRRVRLALLTGALPVSGGLIAEDVPTNAIFAWRVDDYGYAGLVRNRFRIRIVDMADPYCTSVSDVFTIR